MKRGHLLVLLIGLCATLLLTLPIFSIKKVAISSPFIFVSETEAHHTVESLIGKNLFLTWLRNTAEKQLSAHPQIHQSQSRLTFPNTLAIVIEEKTPWLTCVIDGNSLFLDAEGTILSYGTDVSIQETDDIFIVKGLDPAYFTDPSISQSLLSELMALQSHIRDFLPDIPVLLEQYPDHSWGLQLFDSMIVYLGDMDALDSKFERLNYFLGTLNPKEYSKIDTIDCRVDHKLLVSYGN